MTTELYPMNFTQRHKEDKDTKKTKTPRRKEGVVVNNPNMSLTIKLRTKPPSFLFLCALLTFVSL
jgi:hypothetical protein